jgi:hypothetical protein
MSVPPSPILRAASRWIEHLGHSDVRKVQALFTSHSAFSDLTPSQYAAGLSWLERVGFVKNSRAISLGRTPEFALFSAAIADAFWIEDAALLVHSTEEVPLDAGRAADALGLSVDTAFNLIHEASGKIDLAERARVGLGGEVALLSLLRRELIGEVLHVAADSDGYGFDVAVNTSSFTGHFEVKSTTRRRRLTIFLSRHEFETMKRDPNWQLVAVRLDDDLQLRAIATVSREWIASALPIDRRVYGRWESTRLDVPLESLISGLPMIPASARTSRVGVLDGLLGWPG